MAKVVGSPDGYMLIDSKIQTAGLTKDVGNIKGQFSNMAQSASKTGSAIQGAFSGGFSKAVEVAKARVQSLENQLAGVSLDFSSAIQADDDTAAARLGAKMDKIYDKLAVERKRLEAEVSASAKKQAESEERSAKKTEKAHAKANKRAEKGTKRSSKTMRRFSTRLSGIAMSAFLFNSLSAGFRDIAEYIGGAITSTDAMKTALSNLKGAAQQAAAPIIQAITPALTALANAAATAVSYVAQLFAAFSGKSVAQLGESAKAMNKNAKAAGKLSRSVAGFDELTKLQDNSGGGSDGVDPNYGFVANPVEFLELMKQQILQGDWFGAGETLGQAIMDGIMNIDWEGVGTKIGEILGGILSFALGLAVNIDPFQIVGSINSFAIGLFDALSQAIQNLDWADIGTRLTKALLFGLLMADPATAILAILLSPNGGEMASSAAELIGSIIGALARAILSMGQEIGRLTSELWSTIKGYFDECVDWEGTPGEIIEDLYNGIVAALKDVGTWIKENIFQPFIDGFEKAFDINSPSKVMEAEGGNIMGGLFNGLLGGVGRLGEICRELWATITGAFAGLGQWFETTFSDAWQAVLDVFSGDSDVFSGIKEGMSMSFKDIINDLITGLNEVIRTPFNKLNSTLNKIRDWKFGTLTPFDGLWSYNPISVPQIPYLAKGAVIPPRAPFLAMLGDQRNGTNIEAPLSTIQEAMANVLADFQAGNMAGHEAVVQRLERLIATVESIEVGDSTIGEAANRYAQKMAIVRGG